jgi:hypothetical protein
MKGYRSGTNHTGDQISNFVCVHLPQGAAMPGCNLLLLRKMQGEQHSGAFIRIAAPLADQCA